MLGHGDLGRGAPAHRGPYNIADAVVVGILLISLLRHSDRVTSPARRSWSTPSPRSCEPGGTAWRQTIFHPFALTATARPRGTVLRVELKAPTYDTPRYGEVPVLDTAATPPPDEGAERAQWCFVVNRHPQEALRLRLGVAGLGDVSVVGALAMADADPLAANSQQHTDRVVPREIETSLAEAGLYIDLPAVSWSCIRLAAGGAGAPDIVG